MKPILKIKRANKTKSFSFGSIFKKKKMMLFQNL